LSDDDPLPIDSMMTINEEGIDEVSEVDRHLEFFKNQSKPEIATGLIHFRAKSEEKPLDN